MKLRVLVCGDRKWTDGDAIERELRLLRMRNRVQCVIEGEAPGADTLARIAGKKLRIPVWEYPANWAKYGRAAGPIRNRQMLSEGQPNLVLAFHANLAESKGTVNMINQAMKQGIEVRHYVR